MGDYREHKISIGQRFGKLVVKEQIDNHKAHRRYLCICDCGKESKITTGNLMRGTKSCGCLIKERVSKANRGEYGKASVNHVYKAYRNSANRRELLFNLTIDEFFNISQQKCKYCNRDPFKIYKRKISYGDFTYNGIDRVDNSEGYFIDNCVPCCFPCNKMKGTLELEEFLIQINRIYDFQNNKK